MPRTAALRKNEILTPLSGNSAEFDPQRGLSFDRLRNAVPLSLFADSDTGRSERMRQRFLAYGVAAFLELALLFGIWGFLERPDHSEIKDDVSEIMMAPAPTESKPDISQPQKIELPTIKPISVRSPPKLRLMIDRVFPISADQTPPQAPPSQPPPPAPAPAPATSADTIDRFQAAVRAAIQAAIIYPPAARMMKQQGGTKVAFTLTNGSAENPQIIQSSGNPAIDKAALAAVRDASYPGAPAEMAGQPLFLAVFVIFSLSSP